MENYVHEINKFITKNSVHAHINTQQFKSKHFGNLYVQMQK